MSLSQRHLKHPKTYLIKEEELYYRSPANPVGGGPATGRHRATGGG